MLGEVVTLDRIELAISVLIVFLLAVATVALSRNR